MFCEKETARLADWHTGGAAAMPVFTRAAGFAIAKDPRLANCGREDIMRVLCKMAAFGFTPGIHAYIALRDNKPVFIADYRGVLRVWQEDAEVVSPPVLVREGDMFEQFRGVEGGKDVSFLRHEIAKPDGETRQPVIAGYIKWAKQGRYAFNIIDGATLQEIRVKRVGEGSRLWEEFPDDMMLKEVVKRTVKYVCTTAKMISLCKTDDAGEYGEL